VATSKNNKAKSKSAGKPTGAKGRPHAGKSSKSAKAPAKSHAKAKVAPKASAKAKPAAKSAPKPAAKSPPKPAAKPIPPRPMPGKPGAKKPEPPKKPGAPALRAPARTPERAEELKAKIGALATATSQIRALKRTLQRSFPDIGQLLGEIQQKRLFEVKGYGSFEAFLEREIDLGKQLSLRILKISQIFQREAAIALGLDRTVAALSVLEGDSDGTGASSPAPTAAGTRSPIPPHKL